MDWREGVFLASGTGFVAVGETRLFALALVAAREGGIGLAADGG